MAVGTALYECGTVAAGPASSSPQATQKQCVVQLADGRIVSGSADNTLRVWDSVSGACILQLTQSPHRLGDLRGAAGRRADGEF